MKKQISLADDLLQGEMPPWPRELNRPFSPGADPTQARVRVLLALFRRYGVSDLKNWGPRVAIGLASDRVRAFGPMATRPGPLSVIEDPDQLYFVVTAIEAVADGKPNQIEDGPLRRLVQTIASDYPTGSKGRRISAICKALTKPTTSPWRNKSPETLRSHATKMKKAAQRIAASLNDAEAKVI